MDYAAKFIGQTVNVIIDRPLGTKHPKHDLFYSVNYGFIPNTLAPDGEEVDAYILGISEPLTKFIGQCIAVIHRTNNDDNKLIVVPFNTHFTDEAILQQTNFQEKYFQSKIIR